VFPPCGFRPFLNALSTTNCSGLFDYLNFYGSPLFTHLYNQKPGTDDGRAYPGEDYEPVGPAESRFYPPRSLERPHRRRLALAGIFENGCIRETKTLFYHPFLNISITQSAVSKLSVLAFHSSTSWPATYLAQLPSSGVFISPRVPRHPEVRNHSFVSLLTKKKSFLIHNAIYFISSNRALVDQYGWRTP